MNAVPPVSSFPEGQQCPYSSVVEQLTCNEQVVRSNRTGGSFWVAVVTAYKVTVITVCPNNGPLAQW